MTIGQLYDRMTTQLKTLYDDREAASVTGLILESRLGIRRVDRILRKTELLEREQEDLLLEDLRALLAGEPVQYVLGEAWFDGLLLRVNRHVLIPRPETEELVHWVAESGLSAPAILDIGTGSGCIPLALQKRLPEAMIAGLDISGEALALAKENATRHRLPVRFLRADILDETTWTGLSGYDLIVSNPPYIIQREKKDMHERVLDYEPHLALFVPDEDPLLFYRKIARFANMHLDPGGALYLEINEALGAETVRLLEQEGFKQIILKKDLQGKDRMIRAVR
jgi:release factor glutamine methyltransferase